MKTFLDYLIENNSTMPNIKMETMGGLFFWEDVGYLPGEYKIQKMIWNPRHYRILNSFYERVAWGTKRHVQNYINENMQLEAREIHRGDIIAVDRGLADININIYQHFAVYIGNNQVIHYDVIEDSKNAADHIFPSIHMATLDEFLDGSEKFYVLDFDQPGSEAWQVRAKKPSGTSGGGTLSFNNNDSRKNDFNELIKMMRKKEYHIYSPEETVNRAKTKIGERMYNLLINNCEHFAIWCKTGLHKSEQINRLFM